MNKIIKINKYIYEYIYLRENKGMDEVLLREAIEKLKGTEIAEATILHPERQRQRQRQRVKDQASELANPSCFFSDVSLRMQTTFFGIVLTKRLYIARSLL